MTRYFSALPLTLNLVVVYAFMPIITTSTDTVWRQNSILVISLFSMASALHFGLPTYMIRALERKSASQLTILFAMTAVVAIGFLVCFYFYISYGVEPFFVLFFLFFSLFASVTRGFLEYARKFLVSYFVRMVIVSLLPLYIIFFDFLGSFMLTHIIFAFFLIFTFYLARIFFVGVSNLPRTEPVTREEVWVILGFGCQFFSVFVFIFLDRVSLNFTAPNVDPAIFIKEFELVYRLMAPMMFFTSIIFPDLSSQNRTNVMSAMRHVLVFLIVWAFYCLSVPFVLSEVYGYFSIFSEEMFFFDNHIIISFVTFLIGFSMIAQRIILSRSGGRLIFTIFLSSTIFVSLSSLTTTIFFESALFTLAVKSCLEMLIMLFCAYYFVIRKGGLTL